MDPRSYIPSQAPVGTFPAYPTSHSSSLDTPFSSRTANSDSAPFRRISPASLDLYPDASSTIHGGSSNLKSSNGKRKEAKQTKLTDQFPVKKARKFDRFNGMSEEEVMKRGLPDYLKENLDIIFVGINPGLAAAYAGKYYTGPGNHFWKCLYLSGFVQTEMTAKDDYKLLDYGIGFTNMVARTTKGSGDLSKAELREGGKILTGKVQQFRPKIVVFNGKISYEVYSGKKKFDFGVQEERVDGTETRIWVMPSSSARCAQLPRATDKVPFFEALRRFRDYLNGELTGVSDSDFVFTDLKLIGFKRNASSGDGAQN